MTKYRAMISLNRFRMAAKKAMAMAPSPLARTAVYDDWLRHTSDFYAARAKLYPKVIEKLYPKVIERG